MRLWPLLGLSFFTHNEDIELNKVPNQGQQYKDPPLKITPSCPYTNKAIKLYYTHTPQSAFKIVL